MSIQRKIDIIIVNYNSSERIINLLKSVNSYCTNIGNIYIWDNNSNHNERLILNEINSTNIFKYYSKYNLGFSKAVNKLFRKCKNNYVLLLNPDTKLGNANIKLLLENFKNKKVAVVGCKILNDKGENVLSANSKPSFLTGFFEFTILKKLLPNNKFTNDFWIEKKICVKKPIKVHSVCGAFMLINKLKIQGKFFNENYYMYLEDLDLGYRMLNKGLTVIFDPRYHIYHSGGKSNNSKYGTVLRFWYDSRKIFFKHHFPGIRYYLLKTTFIIEEKILYLYHYLKNEPTE